VDQRLGSGVAAAALLGAFTGLALSPAANRSEFIRRIQRSWRRLEHVLTNDRERIGLSVGLAATKVADLAHYVLDRISEAVAASGSPITRIRRALSRHERLATRAISVDAIADIIIIQGAVESEEEWQAADFLAHMTYPEGSIRNHLRIQRSSATE